MEGKTHKDQILEVLSGETSMSPKQIASATGLESSAVRVLIRQMLHQGLVAQHGYGKYKLPPSLETISNRNNVYPLGALYKEGDTEELEEGEIDITLRPGEVRVRYIPIEGDGGEITHFVKSVFRYMTIEEKEKEAGSDKD